MKLLYIDIQLPASSHIKPEVLHMNFSVINTDYNSTEDRMIYRWDLDEEQGHTLEKMYGWIAEAINDRKQSGLIDDVAFNLGDLVLRRNY